MNPLRWVALVALEEAELPDEQALRAYLSEFHPDAPATSITRATDALLTCTMGDYTAAMTLAPREIPRSQLEGPCATAWYWPDAAEQLRDHRAHLIVALVDEAGRSIDKSICLTRLVAAAAQTTRSRGVFWGPGRLLHPPAAFHEQATQMSSEDLPLFLWVDFRVERTQQSVRLYTTGLEALGQTELEAEGFTGEPQTLLEYAYNVAHYMLTQNKSIEEGHTIGLTDEVQVVAHRSKSMFDESLDVIQLEFAASP